MIGSILITASFAVQPLLGKGKCDVSNLWGTEAPKDMPADQDRHLVHVQGKQIFYNTRLMTIERVVADVGPDMAQGSDLLVIDASDAAKCALVKELATALEGPAACTPQRCFVSSVPVGPRKAPEEPAKP